MIKHWLITGDTHGRTADRLDGISRAYPDFEPSETALIILGDSGIDFYLNKTDNKWKNTIANKHYRVYCLRGNHEARPQDIEGMTDMYDPDVEGYVWVHPTWPQIRYFKDGGIYEINNLSVLTIGGAYSVDKHYRLQRGAPWFENEQLSEKERAHIHNLVNGKHFDIVMTHTCPLRYEPTDLFLNFIDQSTVDKSMEKWLNILADDISWGLWLFGHYHADRIERPFVEQYFGDVSTLDEILDRWEHYANTGEIDWWLTKSPNFYMEDK